MSQYCSYEKCETCKKSSFHLTFQNQFDFVSEKKNIFLIFLLGYESAIHEKDATLSANYAPFTTQLNDNVKQLS